MWLQKINYMDHVPIASVEQFPYLQGQKATDILLDLLSAGKQTIKDKQGYFKVIVESRLIKNKKKKLAENGSYTLAIKDAQRFALSI